MTTGEHMHNKKVFTGCMIRHGGLLAAVSRYAVAVCTEYRDLGEIASFLETVLPDMIAFVGESGGGKSTIFRILRGLPLPEHS